MTPEELQAEFAAYLEGIDWTGDAERIAQWLARAHSRGARVVGFRRRGREVLLYDSDALTTHELGPGGQVHHLGTVWKRRDLGEWLEHHRFYLDWVNPEYRRR